MRLPAERTVKRRQRSTSRWPPGPANKSLPGGHSYTRAPCTPCSRGSSGGLESADETRQQSVDCPRMEEPAACGFRNTESSRKRDVQGRRNLAILAASNRVDPRLVGSSRAAGSLGDIEADAGRGAQRLIPQAALRDGGFAHSVEQLARLLVGMKLFKGQISKLRYRRLLSKSG